MDAAARAEPVEPIGCAAKVSGHGARLRQVLSSRATLAKRRADVSSMFDSVASRYDLMNDVLTMGIDRQWRHDVVEAIEAGPGMTILDLAAGTGTSSEAFRAAGASVFATDLSLGMLRVGKQRQPLVNFVAGDALQLPYADNTFDATTISFGLRNVEDTVGGLRELLRVTKPGGRVVVCEFSTPTSALLRTAYQRGALQVLPTVAKLSSNPPAYHYLCESILAWPNQQTLAGLMADAGWQAVGWRNLSGGIVALHRGWKGAATPATA